MLTFSLWVIVGVLAGIAARAIAPPPSKKSKQVRTSVMILAILGAIVAGMMGDLLARGSSKSVGTDYSSVLAACLGALVIVAVARVLETHIDR